MIDQPKVSIITPLFNREEFIQETWHSIKNQTHENWEWIVVDDGSDDQSFKMIMEWGLDDLRIKPFKRDRLPKGAPTCRNIGLHNATGDYIIFFDSDDLLAKHCLSQRVRAFSTQKAKEFLVFPILIFESERPDYLNYWNIESGEDIIERFVRFDAPWQTMGPIYKRNYLEKNGLLFDENLPYRQDFEFHVSQLLDNPDYAIMWDKEPDCLLRHHAGASISQYAQKSQKHLGTDDKIFRGLVEKIKKSSFERKAILLGYCRSVLMREAKVYNNLDYNRVAGLLAYISSSIPSGQITEKFRFWLFIKLGRVVHPKKRIANYLWRLLVEDKNALPKRTLNTVSYNGELTVPRNG